MKVGQWTGKGRLQAAPTFGEGLESPDALLVLGPRAALEDGATVALLTERWPEASLIGCTTAGEVTSAGAADGALVVTALSFAHARTKVAATRLGDDHREAGRRLADALAGDDLRALSILSEGLHTHVQDLLQGLQERLPADVVVGGGLAGDGDAFETTGVLTSAGYLPDHAAALAFYGPSIIARCASASGWHPFGLERRVTRSSGSVVFEIDDARALDVYSRYLGDEAERLPSSGLVYPVAVSLGDEAVIRSLSAIDRDTGALSFFGDIPEGSHIRLMHASNGELVAGAAQSADRVGLPDDRAPDIAFLFSCAGRKAVLGTATDLEVAAVQERLPAGTPLAGFYTYGEIGVFGGTGPCEHHNQTMTVLALADELTP